MLRYLFLFLFLLKALDASSAVVQSIKPNIEKMIEEETGLEHVIVVFDNMLNNEKESEWKIESSDIVINMEKATFSLKDRGAIKNIKPVTGRYEIADMVPIYSFAFKKGHELQDLDIKYKKISMSANGGKDILSKEDIVGKVLNRTVPAGIAITATDLKSKPIINKEQLVKIIFSKGNLTIEAMGTAIDSGAKGDLIKVRNNDNSRIIKGWIIDENTVSVSKYDN